MRYFAVFFRRYRHSDRTFRLYM